MTTKTVAITGGNRGIGLCITEAFLESGYRVFVGARNSDVLPHNVLNQITFIPTDVRNHESVAYFIDSTISETGHLDVLINNAGYSEWRPISRIDVDFLDDIIDTNIKGVFWACKAAAAVMHDNASIINISSIAGKRGSSNNSAYVATKFAVNGITQSLAKELGPRGIRVNGVCPVLVSTDGLLTALAKSDAPGFEDPVKFIHNFAKTQTALNRLPTGDEVAAMCIFLASSNASAITGQNINVDCGVFPQ